MKASLALQKFSSTAICSAVALALYACGPIVPSISKNPAKSMSRNEVRVIAITANTEVRTDASSEDKQVEGVVKYSLTVDEVATFREQGSVEVSVDLTGIVPNSVDGVFTLNPAGLPSAKRREAEARFRMFFSSTTPGKFRVSARQSEENAEAVKTVMAHLESVTLIFSTVESPEPTLATETSPISEPEFR